MTMSPSELLDELLHLGVATHTYKRIGCCYRGVVNLPGDSQTYFKPGRPLSVSLTKKLSSPKYRTLPHNMHRQVVRNTLSNAYKTSKAITKMKKYTMMSGKGE